MTKLTYRTSGENGIEWQALGDDGKPLGEWHPTQWQARLDAFQAIPQPDGNSEDLNANPS